MRAETGDFLALDAVAPQRLETLMRRAAFLERCWLSRKLPRTLQGARVGLVVDDRGWRNTTAFDLGVTSLGGSCIHVPLSLGGAEAISDLATYLDNWFDIVVVRTPELSALEELAHFSQAPVINARTIANHPCEVLGDLSFIHRLRGELEGLTVAVVAPAANILRSWCEAAATLRFQVIQVYPEKWHARGVTAGFRATTDISELARADLIITDCWPSEADPGLLLPFQVTGSLLSSARRDAIFLPCPPVTRGREVSRDAMASPMCQVVAAKAFLLHAQNAVLEKAYEATWKRPPAA